LILAYFWQQKRHAVTDGRIDSKFDNNNNLFLSVELLVLSFLHVS